MNVIYRGKTHMADTTTPKYAAPSVIPSDGGMVVDIFE